MFFVQYKRRHHWPSFFRRTLPAIVVGFASSQAMADYTISMTSGGEPSAVVLPGNSFVLDIGLWSSTQAVHNSSIVRVVFSEPGLVYESYEWHAPYTNGSSFDDSLPHASALPAILNAGLLSGPAYPPDVVDVELSSVVPTGHFGQGDLVSMLLTVPADYSGPSQIDIWLEPDTIANGFTEVHVSPSPVFLLIVPSPSSASLAFSLACICSCRRRR